MASTTAGTRTVTQERYASGMTYEEYVAYVGTPRIWRANRAGQRRGKTSAASCKTPFGSAISRIISSQRSSGSSISRTAPPRCL